MVAAARWEAERGVQAPAQRVGGTRPPGAGVRPRPLAAGRSPLLTCIIISGCMPPCQGTPAAPGSTLPQAPGAACCSGCAMQCTSRDFGGVAKAGFGGRGLVLRAAASPARSPCVCCRLVPARELWVVRRGGSARVEGQTAHGGAGMGFSMPPSKWSWGRVAAPCCLASYPQSHLELLRADYAA